MSTQPVITRFAPSPTGFLHIGGARTALFNWLFARANGGKFLLRIEDTDKARSTPEATEAIFEGMRWLGLDWDGEAVSQASRAERHAEVANEMLAKGAAYKCFSTQDEIAAFREAAKAEGRSTVFQSPWRDAEPSTHPDAPFVIRVKAPRDGETRVADAVQGDVSWKNETLDDLIILRSDGSPTYMLAVVVDDHDMGVTHVIRGDDHLTNAARQVLIFDAMGWERPTFAHIPLIHGPDGAKFSKRHGAPGVESYRDMGYPAAAMRNYLARLSWSHGDEEFFTTEQAIEWFSLDAISKGAARFDFKKLDNLSGQHIRATDDAALTQAMLEFMALQHNSVPDTHRHEKITQAMSALKDRAKTYADLVDMSYYLRAERPLEIEEKAAKQLDDVSRGMLEKLTERLRNANWSLNDLEAEIKAFAGEEDLKLGKVMQPMRSALTGRATSPSVFDVLVQLGRDESLARIEDQLAPA
ncbi:glutamate--tRNA ligase [Pontivivens insulae]|uniref:Glutamate--tRNA ligase n=1 Tax=Pontivivens insulae TaxID=1639689 RepID=A0A2R8AAQ4_9RHOB|nr:glutamate--tRNA ligase [Pontivivens insulae]RED13220.1 glutamyl-tRNA synthetase [Pontivivens insulae]SPF29312.1 Glutamate--tRNA ligase [Pontivivens insulae]